MTDTMTTPAERVRDSVTTDLRDRLKEKFETVKGGPLDGVRMVSEGNFDDAWRGYWEEFEMPLPSEHAGEVATPARVVTALVCPECQEHVMGSVRVTAVLTAEGAKRTLKAKSATVPVDHVHGQMTLVEDTDEVGTEPFDVGDITGVKTDDDHDEEVDDAVDDDRPGDDNADGDLLPGEDSDG